MHEFTSEPKPAKEEPAKEKPQKADSLSDNMGCFLMLSVMAITGGAVQLFKFAVDGGAAWAGAAAVAALAGLGVGVTYVVTRRSR
jgi:hypothetical protein